MESFDFSKKKILIAGVGGIGSAVVSLLASLNAELYLLDIDVDKCNKLTLDYKNVKGYLGCDFSNVNGIEIKIDEIIAQAGPLDGFVFCSGITASRPFKMAKYDAMLNVMNINFFSFVEIVRCITKKKNYNIGMSIVGLSSVGAILGNPSQTAYCASKAAMNGAV